MPAHQTCEQCHERTAEVHITRLIEDREEHIHLCRVCAAPHLSPASGVGRGSSGWSVTSADGKATYFPDGQK